jgi:TonB family protein
MRPNSLRDKRLRCILLRSGCIDFPSWKIVKLREKCCKTGVLLPAMSFFSDTRETSARYGTYVAEFQELCKRHELKFGTPEDFFRLAPKLAYDESFRADFCQLTKSVAQREDGHLTLTRILTIIAIAIGGEGIDTVGTAGAVPVSLVVVFLAGIGGWREDESDYIAAQATTLPMATSTEATSMASDREELEGLALEHKLASEPNKLDEMTASLFGGPAMVKEALCRLELNTLELKLHLDSIDSRMERIEPHLDDLTSRLELGNSRQKADTAHRMEQLPTIRYSQPEFRVEKAENRPEVLQDKKRPQSDKSEMRRLHGPITALGILFVVMAAALGMFLYIGHGRTINARVGSIVAGTVGDASAKTTTPSPLAKEASVTSSLSNAQAALPGTGESRPSSKSAPSKVGSSVVRMPSGQGESQRKISLPISKEEEPPRSLGIHLADALPSAVATRSADEPGARLVGAKTPAATATPAPVSAAGERAPLNKAEVRTKIFVPASALLHYAIAQPPPAYPSVARLQRVEGDVLLQALVDERGRVEDVTVVNGPGPLRNAAIDALRNWRFKPYLLDGHPVAVRTFVDFHFKMNE